MAATGWARKLSCECVCVCSSSVLRCRLARCTLPASSYHAIQLHGGLLRARDQGTPSLDKPLLVMTLCMPAEASTGSKPACQHCSIERLLCCDRGKPWTPSTCRSLCVWGQLGASSALLLLAVNCRRSKGPQGTPRWNAALPILYSVFSALLGTQSVLFSKTLAVLMRSTFTGDNQVSCRCHTAGLTGVDPTRIVLVSTGQYHLVSSGCCDYVGLEGWPVPSAASIPTCCGLTTVFQRAFTMNALRSHTAGCWNACPGMHVA